MHIQCKSNGARHCTGINIKIHTISKEQPQAKNIGMEALRAQGHYLWTFSSVANYNFQAILSIQDVKENSVLIDDFPCTHLKLTQKVTSLLLHCKFSEMLFKYANNEFI